ncbi:MAG: hypothetical protein LBS14_00560 [Holosporaceae bacterium]|jgi:hypothetical protein|nr:hypothetical protein [Holosporaceae bacterium]
MIPAKRIAQWDNHERKYKILEKKSRGAVLLEFAYAIPILIMMMYFGLDVPNSSRFATKMHKTSELYSQMLINLIRSRYDRTIHIQDLINISRSIGLVFTGTYLTNKYKFHLVTCIISITGLADNKFKVNGCIGSSVFLNGGTVTAATEHEKALATVTETHSNAAHPGKLVNLHIKRGERKLLIETIAYYYPNSEERGFNATFYLLTIKGVTAQCGNNNAVVFRDKTAILTPPEGTVVGNFSPF